MPMLASPPVRAAGERVGRPWGAFAAAAICFCALFFGGGPSDAPLVWIGGGALVLAALLLIAPPLLDGPAALLLGGLLGLAVWSGISIVWSTSPDRTWTFTNRTLVYFAFALLGVVVGARVTRAQVAYGAAALLGLLLGWALLAKCVPALYSDYGRLARLRAPLEYWNELALVCDVGVPVALWLAVARRRVEGVVLLYAVVVTLLLTYSRFGVALACAAAVVWILVERSSRLESLTTFALGASAGTAAFGVALALPGITKDEQSRSVRAHDGWVFALVLIAGAVLVYGAARLAARHPVAAPRRSQVERLAGIAALVLAVAGVALSIAFAGRIWHEFTNPGNTQVVNTTTRLKTTTGDRWVWWQEAWHAFTRHPAGGTGAGTFELTNDLLRRTPVVVDEPHNVPLQFLTETGIVGFLLYLVTAAGALWGAWRARREPAGLALGLATAAFFGHAVVDKDWNYVATCGPLFFLSGSLLATRQHTAPARRPLLAACAVAVALAAVYSITAPWLAQRQLASASTVAQVKHARTYDPLSVEALLELAAFETAPSPQSALGHYLDAVKLEPENAEAWFQLGSFYFSYKEWQLAYEALNNSYTYNRFGPASKRCGLLDQARTKAFNYTPPRLKQCRGSQRSSSP
jgi:O-antigen ligase